jgi:hypothetical protein
MEKKHQVLKSPGDRQQLLQRLRRCRLGRKATAFNLEVNQAQQVTQVGWGGELPTTPHTKWASNM